MKKVLLIITIFFSLLLGLTANATTPNYATDITESSSIAEDFKSMGKDLNSYSANLPDNYLDYFGDGNCFELVDFQVAKVSEEEAVIYLYVYDPMRYDKEAGDYIETFWTSFDIEDYDFENDYDKNNNWTKQLEYDAIHGIWKLKGYKFKYSNFNRITITSILGAMAIVEHRIQTFPNVTKEIIFKETLLPIPTPEPAEEITSKSSIKDDFVLMGMDVEDYYISSKFDFSKWYVVAMSFEVLEEGKVQSYFYLYNPKRISASAFEISYKLNASSNTDFFWQVKMDPERSLYKLKGVVFDYAPGLTYKLSIKNITGGEVYSESNFEVTAVFSSSAEEVSVQSNFDSTIIIDEYDVVEIEVHQDDNFINGWNSFCSGKDPSVLVYFYNFNFPKHIQYDEVIFAKFQYDYLTVYEKIWTHQENFAGPWVPDDRYSEHNVKDIKDSEKVISEYNNESRTIRVNKNSQELTFPTFYLGDRIKDKQFGTLKVTGEAATRFNYDCSVLLESTYKTRSDWYGNGPSGKLNQHYMELNYTTLDEIELIELHYKNDGVVYKCQVITQSVDNEDFVKGEATSSKPWYKDIWEFFILLGNFVLKIFGLGFLPNVAKGIVGIISCIAFIWAVFKLLKLLKRLLKKLFS